MGSKMLDCVSFSDLSKRHESCEQTSEGLRLATHCVYPSFEPVYVYIVPFGDGFIVHDDSGAGRLSWMYGVDTRSLGRLAKKAAAEFGCDYNRGQMRCTVESEDWLWSAILAVANASAESVRAAVGKNRLPKEQSMISRAKRVFDKAKWKPETILGFDVPGKSGKLHKFDLAVISGGATAILDAVVPHQNSIAAKYLALSDAENQPGFFKYSLYDAELSTEDKALLSNVSDLVHIKSLIGTDGRFLIQ